MMQWLDQYEIKARMIPTLIVLSPLLLTLLFVLIGVFESLPVSLGSLGGVAVLAVLLSYALSFGPQQLGKGKQEELWASWDGAPTTRMMRLRDGTLDEGTKRLMRERAQRVSGVALLSEEEEAEDPEEADRRIGRAIGQAREVVRQESAGGLWSRHNADYGLCRNLLGARWLWVASSLLGALVCAGFWYFYERNGYFVTGFVLSAASLPIALVAGLYLLPRLAKRFADRYAENLLGAFLAGAGTKEGE